MFIKSKKKNILNFSSTLISNLVVTMSKWLVLILIARILTPTDVGEYTLAFAITAPVALLLNMKLRSLYITEQNPNFKNYLILRYILVVVFFIGMIIVSMVLWREKALIIIVVFANKLLDLISDTYYGIPHSKKNMILISRLSITKVVIELLSFGIVLALSRNLLISLTISLLAKLIFVYFIEITRINSYRKKDEKIVWKIVISTFWLSVPLGVTQMLVSLNTNISRYFIEYYEGTKEVGIFASISYILVIFNLFASAISQYFLPYLNDIAVENDNEKFMKFLNMRINMITLLVGISITILLSTFAPQILTLLYGKEYASMSDILVVVCISTLLNTLSWNYDTALMAIRYISIQPKIIAITLMLNVVVTYVLVKSNGIYGAAYSLVIISLIQLLLRIVFLRRKLKGG